MTATIIRGNALDLPLADNSVDLVVTSPPYFGLRSYQDGGAHYAGQLGSEATPAEFVDALIAATREMVRVTKPSGSIFVNLGDKFSGGKGAYLVEGGGYDGVPVSRPVAGMRPKTLLGMPWRYALRCIDDLGLILRAEIIWSKPNGLPESVTDRVRRSHETWFHLVQQPRYFSAVDEIREEHTEAQRPGVLTWEQRRSRDDRAARYSDQNGHGGTAGMAQSPLGKLPGSVRTVPTEPLRVPDTLGVDHFAAFPTAWPKWLIRGWAPTRGVCAACGQGRAPVAAVTPVASKPFAVRQHERSPLSGGTRTQALGYPAAERDRAITGYACACPEPTAPTLPAVILDPFGGTGTTALVANALGCHGITVDMSADYCRLAEWRVNDPGQLAKVIEVDKPAEQIRDQLDLFGGAA